MMYRKLTVAFAAATLVSASLFGQNCKTCEQNYRYWTDGPLTVNDFTARMGNDNQGMSSCLAWNIAVKDFVTKTGNLRYNGVVCDAYENTAASWYNPEEFTPESLKYHQVMFDMVEIQSRKAQAEFQRHIDSPECIKESNAEAILNRIQTYEQETGYGTNSEVIDGYAEMCRRELLRQNQWSSLMEPAYSTGNWGTGFYAGYEGEVFFGPAGDGIKMYNGVTLGFEVAYKNLSLDLGGSFGWAGKLKETGFNYDYDKKYNWKKDKACYAGNLQAALGYRVLDTRYVSIKPMAGVGLGVLTQKTDKKDCCWCCGFDNYSFENGFRVFAGAEFGFKMLRNLWTSNSGAGKYNENSLALRVFAARTGFQNVGASYSVNFGLTYDFMGWRAR